MGPGHGWISGPPQPGPAPSPSGPRPLGIGELFEIVPRVYRHRWRVFLGVATVFLAPVYVLLGIVQTDAMTRLLPLMSRAPGGFDFTLADLEIVQGAFLPLVGVSLLAGLVTFVANAALMRAAATTYLEGRADLGDAVGVALRRLPALLGASIATILALAAVVSVGVLLALLAVIAMGRSGAEGAGGGGPGVFVALIVIVALVVAVVVLMLRWVLAPAAIVVERAGPLRGLGRSWELTAGALWRTLGILLLFGLIVGVFQALLGQVVILLLGGGSMGFGSMGFVSAPPAPVFIVSGLVAIPLTPVVPIALTVHYFDRRVRREGFTVGPGVGAAGETR